ncbi:hypothetical protein JOD54_004920 [Actinokineospora baliensis]|uniref:hypothetical protein n=1 Tax=Actinokineospora baliensis TaxID=547056 RepID=UPI00195E4ED2|nr:hypothetical protein [Actinokineospora baliensis]MBM7774716.1 hypothetical protein [Actinokineospora baliensis]
MPGADGAVGDLVWSEVSDLFVPDGSLLDAYVFDTTVGDWQVFVDLVRSRGLWCRYSEDGHPKPLPEQVEAAFERQAEVGVLLQIRPVPQILVNTHFFTPDEIEVDFAPQELQGQERLNTVCAFLRAVSRRLGKPMVLTPENGPDHPLIGYDVDLDRVMRMAPRRANPATCPMWSC